MIVVTGRVQIPAPSREEFLAVAREMCAASRGDDGCIGYRVYEDLEQPGRYVFIEEWRDDEALQATSRMPAHGEFMAALPGPARRPGRCPVPHRRRARAGSIRRGA